MSTLRKLQTEIDRLLKKIQEGIAEFNEIWEKVHTAVNANQKEKYEADLKREIKKLQRYRDQIKSWAGGNEIKDKSALVAARKQIEAEMERFKVCEKETKTKPYSKEGLQQFKPDPHEGPKNDALQWIARTMATLREQIDHLEAQIEERKAKKKRDGIKELEDCIQHHNFHLTQLEKAMRCLDNDAITPEQVMSLQPDVAYYIEENQGEKEASEVQWQTFSDNLECLFAGCVCPQNPDFQFNEDVYADLNLDVVDVDPLLVGGEHDSVSSIEGDTPLSSPAASPNMGPSGPPAPGVAPSPLPSPSAPPAAPRRGKQSGVSPPLTPTTTPASLGSPAPAASSSTRGAAAPPPSPSPKLAVPPSSPKVLSRTELASPPSSGAPTPLLSSSSANSTGATRLPPPHPKPAAASAPSAHPLLPGAPATANPVQQRASSPPASPLPARPAAAPQPSRLAPSGGGPKSAAAAASQKASSPPSTPASAPPLPSSSSAGNKAAPPRPTQILSHPHASPSPASTTTSTPPGATPTPAASDASKTALPSASSTGSLPLPLSPAPAALLASPPAAASAPPPSPQARRQSVVPSIAPRPATGLAAGSAPSTVPSPAPTAVGASSVPPEAVAEALDTIITRTVDQKQPPAATAQRTSAPAQPAGAISTSPSAAAPAAVHAVTTQQVTSPSGTAQPSAQQTPPTTQQSGSTPAQPSRPGRPDPFAMLEASFHNMPDPYDGLRPRPYVARYPHPTPSYFPQHPLRTLRDPALFASMDPDTLFFIFYYQQGTYEQYLAARALKSRAWCFHKKYGTWFQRHSEPTHMTAEYEDGTYVYFDPSDSGWCQRVKEKFRFEYTFLEESE